MYDDDEIIRGAPLGPRATSVQARGDFTLLLTFNNGERRVFDAKPLFSMRVFQPLMNKGFFSLVKVEHGTVCWPKDIDYCPDTLYLESELL